MAAFFEGEVDVPAEAIDIVDSAVIERLPSGSAVKSIKAWGTSNWTRTARVSVQLKDGPVVPYFLKVSFGQRGKDMMIGEFASMSTIKSTTPNFAPMPIGWGTFESNIDCHFYLCSFHTLRLELPEIKSFISLLAFMHTNSMSPSRKYGFDVTTFQGNLPQDNRWTETWEEFFTQGIRRMLKLEEETQGYSAELADLCFPFYEKIIPRLLRPLETCGNNIKPCLVHGDLYFGNVAIDSESGMPIIFDACCFYAHNEYELGTWRPARYRLGKEYIDEYHQVIPPSAPHEDQDDRNALYSIRFNLHASALYTGNTEFRQMVIDEMQRLANKYPGGYDEWASGHSEAYRIDN